MGARLRANIMYYHIYLYHGNKHNYHCVITQTLQNGQTLGQFFELLYGLKQAGRMWYQEMSWVLVKDLGFTCSTVDHSVFFWRLPNEHTIIVVTTDDMVVTLKWAEDITRFKADIQSYWEITDNGPIRWFLGFQIMCNCTTRTISINQSTYIQAMVDKFRLTNSTPVATPMVTGATFSTSDSPSTPMQIAWMRGIPYAEAISSVLWLVIISWPDAAFAVSILSQFIQNPRHAHWEALKHVIVFLGSMKDLWLTFGGRSKPAAEGFCNVDWGGQKHCHSILGYSFHMGAGAISWSSKKQHVVVLSSTKAEYIVQTHMAKEALWLCIFLWELCSTPDDLLILNCNNQGAITLTKNNKFHVCTKHIDMHYHFIHEVVEDGKVVVQYILTGDNVSDIFTKPLTKAKFRELTELLGLCAIMCKV